MPAAEKTRLLLDISDRKAEVLIEKPAAFDGARIAVLCHPHPLYEGSMDNKVVHTMARALHDLGVLTLRFNFRGVGQSTGEHDEGHGETDDCMVLSEWLLDQHAGAELWLGGFSFGGMVATLAAGRLKAAGVSVGQLVTIAPAVGFIESGETPEPDVDWLLVQGAEDEIVAPQAVLDWVDTLSAPPKVVMLEGTGHFFHGQIVTLKETLITELR